MNAIAWRRHRLLNALQSLMLLVAMALILGALGWVVGGDSGLLWALVGGALLVAFNPGFSPRLILRMYGARPLARHVAPDVHALLDTFAARAALPATPELHYVSSQMLNAFAVGTRANAAIAVTDALLRTLSARELAGVLAHEVSHVRHNDMWVMGLADLFSRMTSAFSTLGQMLLFLNLPLLMFSEYGVSWLLILILVFAPTLSALMQLALSRTREYDADLGAVELTGDPRGLAMALEKMERYQGRFFEQILFPGRRVPDPSLLRTHPPTEERIRRLLELEPRATPSIPQVSRAIVPPDAYRSAERRPRWHINGMWY